MSPGPRAIVPTATATGLDLRPREPRVLSFWNPLSPGAARLYLLGLVVWRLLQSRTGDTFWWLYLFNIVGDYLVALAAPMAFLALQPYRRVRWAAAGLSFAVVAATVGHVRPTTGGVSAAGAELSVLTYNLLGSTTDGAAVIADLRHAHADVVCLQEMHSEIGKALARDLRVEYPYQVLDPRYSGVWGMGVLSRYPLRATDQALEGAWIGKPQVLELAWNGTSIALVNGHATHALGGRPSVIDQRNEGRARAAHAITELVQSRSGPTIVCGDFNSTSYNTVYRVLSTALADSWREVGVGPGYSWNMLPGLPGLFRIDYVWHSSHFQAIHAAVEPSSGFSDHHPVVARLVLQTEPRP